VFQIKNVKAMKKKALLLLITVLSLHASPQEKLMGIDLGVNKLHPTNTGSAYEADIGLQAGVFSRKDISKSFSFEKGIYFTITRFDDHNEQNVLALENTTYALSVPLKYYWTRIKSVHPFFGVEGIWRFYSDTDYFITDVQQNEVSKLQLAFVPGIEVRVGKQMSFNLKYIVTPYLISYGTMDLNGFQFSIMYSFKNLLIDEHKPWPRHE
jgi:hypothetical protein